MSIHTEISIDAPPEEVRRILLDFSSIPTWSHTFVKSIAVARSSSKANTVEIGDQLNVVLEGMTVKPIVKSNSPTQLLWRGSLLGIFVGHHSFEFFTGDEEGATRFVHSEEFSGLLAFIMRRGWALERSTRAGFESFNRELKARCEGGSGAEKGGF